jgi:Pentapeptide repeats (9 copies)
MIMTFWSSIRCSKRGLSVVLRVMTLLSSVATVIAFILFLTGRATQESIQAWQILQGYKGQPYNIGQILALETLVRHHQSLRRLELSNLVIDGADLRWADMKSAHLVNAHFDSTRLDYANLADSALSYSVFRNCRCRGTNFSNSHIQNGDFEGADLDRAKFDGANLTGSDFTKMKYRRRGWGSGLPADPDQFASSCWDVGNPDGPPELPSGFRAPQRKAVVGYTICE